MVKILSQGGQSLADMYQAEGSIAGIDQLETTELPIVHEMGATLFSERFQTTNRRIVSGNVLQNAEFDVVLTTMPNSITRILGVQVISPLGSRILNCQVSAFDSTDTGGTDFPLWVYDGTTITSVRVNVDGTVSSFSLLQPLPGSVQVPSFLSKARGRSQVRDISLRGETTGFGAGNASVIAMLYVAFTFTGGVSAFGARVPSW